MNEAQAYAGNGLQQQSQPKSGRAQHRVQVNRDVIV
jgi:hypothetical protein